MFEETLEVGMFDKKNPVEFLAPKIGNYFRLRLGRLNQVFLETEKKTRDESWNFDDANGGKYVYPDGCII